MRDYVVADGRDSDVKKPELPQPLMGTQATSDGEWVRAD